MRTILRHFFAHIFALLLGGVVFLPVIAQSYSSYDDCMLQTSNDEETCNAWNRLQGGSSGSTTANPPSGYDTYFEFDPAVDSSDDFQQQCSSVRGKIEVNGGVMKCWYKKSTQTYDECVAKGQTWINGKCYSETAPSNDPVGIDDGSNNGCPSGATLAPNKNICIYPNATTYTACSARQGYYDTDDKKCYVDKTTTKKTTTTPNKNTTSTTLPSTSGCNLTGASTPGNEPLVKDPDTGLCVPQSQLDKCKNKGSSIICIETVGQAIATVIKYLLQFAAIVGTIMVVIGGYQYMTAQGNSEQAGKGRQTVVYALIGLALIMMAYAIITIVSTSLTGGSLFG